MIFALLKLKAGGRQKKGQKFVNFFDPTGAHGAARLIRAREYPNHSTGSEKKIWIMRDPFYQAVTPSSVVEGLYAFPDTDID